MDALAPGLGSRRYLNYLSEDDDANAAASAFGPNQERLLRVKREYDPENVFHVL